MKTACHISFCLLLLGCKPVDEPVSVSTDPADTASVLSFKIGNEEIMADVIDQLDKQGVPHSINADGSVSHPASATETIDQIVFVARAVWIAAQ